MPHLDIVDLSHSNSGFEFHGFGSAVGCILKCSQGLSEVDPAFGVYRVRAEGVFGAGCVQAYHFGDGSDGVAQARHALASAGGLFVWLDWEDNVSQMDLGGAVEFIHEYRDRAGFWPGIYCRDLGVYGDALSAGHFAPCPRWIARYRSEVPDHACDLWQFTDCALGEFDGSQILNPGGLAWFKGLGCS